MKKSLLFLVLSLLVASSAFGFDGVRKGFVLGGGLGLGMTTYTFEAEYGGLSATSDRGNKFAFMTDFKIGYAPTNQMEIVYSAKGAWFSDKIFYGNNETFLADISTATANYYFKPEGPTPFIGGGIGLASLTQPFENDDSLNVGNWFGFGFYVGGGYEFAKHFAVAVDLMYGLPTITDSGIDFTFKGFTPRLTVIATAF